MSYSLINLTSDVTLSWPYPFTGGVVVSNKNNIISDNDLRTMTLPSSKLVTVGTSLLFNNVGFHDFTLLDNSGAPIGNIILPSEIREIYLTDTSTDAGIWCMIPFGEGSSAISVISATSSNNSINITPGTITAPSGNFDFFYPTEIRAYPNKNAGQALIPSKIFNGNIRDEAEVIDWVLSITEGGQ